jgi:hypothetical protein
MPDPWRWNAVYRCGVKFRLSCSPIDTAEAYLGSEPNQGGLTLAPESIWPSQSPGRMSGPYSLHYHGGAALPMAPAPAMVVDCQGRTRLVHSSRAVDQPDRNVPGDVIDDARA